MSALSGKCIRLGLCDGPCFRRFTTISGNDHFISLLGSSHLIFVVGKDDS